MSLFDMIQLIENLKNEPVSSSVLYANIDGIMSTGDITVRVIPFSSDKGIDILLPSRVVKNRRAILKWKHDDTMLYSIEYTYKENSHDVTIAGDIFVVSQEVFRGSHIAISFEDSTFFKRVLIPYLEGMYPDISFTFIKHNKYKQLLWQNISSAGFKKVSINRASVRFRFLDQKENRRKMSAVIWPSMNLEEAFTWVQENNSYFNSLSLKILLSYGFDYSVTYTRRGILTTNIQFQHHMNNLITPVCELMMKNRSLFGKRSRIETTNASVRPLVIEFPLEYFAKKEENHKFIDAIRTFKNSSVSVMHGNPYIHLSIIDYCDGSTYDLWVLSSTRLVVVPQLKGTIESIGRLLSHVFDTFAEGKILDYQEISNG